MDLSGSKLYNIINVSTQAFAFILLGGFDLLPYPEIYLTDYLSKTS